MQGEGKPELRVAERCSHLQRGRCVLGDAGLEEPRPAEREISEQPWVTSGPVHGYDPETHPLSHGPALGTDHRHRRRHHHRSTRSQQQRRSTRECSGALSRLPAGTGESRARRTNGLSNRPPNHKPQSRARGPWINQEHPNALRS